MKKVFLVAGLLTLSTAALSASATDPVTGIVEVKAKIVQPLDIETAPVDYGIMIPGQTIGWAEQAGTVKITGTTGERIKLEIKTSESDGYTTYKGPTDIRPVELKTGTGAAANQKMTAQLTLFTAGIQGDNANEGLFILEENGKKEFTINGSLAAAQNQLPGNYTGQIHVRAMYE